MGGPKIAACCSVRDFSADTNVLLATRRGLVKKTELSAYSNPRLGGIIELVGGLAVMLGFQTRLAAFLCSGMMLVAYVQFHWKFQFGPEFFPAINKGELAALYCVVFFLIACRGGIKWCLDKKD